MALFFRILGRGLQLLLAAALWAWVGMAIHFQIEPPFAVAMQGLLAAAALTLLFFALKRRWGAVWGVMTAVALVFSGWWMTITPRQDRDWRVEVSRGVTSQNNGDSITVNNIRNFDWTSETEGTPRWKSQAVDPNAITSVDMALSVWDNPDIAHTLVSFGFKDGQHIVFSGEIRKENGEVFSTLGGFFRRYELVLIAADERDIIRLRTDIRGEEVSLYPINISPEQRKALFLAFLDYGNDLAITPRWYNTLTTNCTTMPYALVREISDKVPLDRRIILSGRLPEYLYEIGVLPKGLSIAEIRNRARLGKLGPGGSDGPAFSRYLRRAWETRP